MRILFPLIAALLLFSGVAAAQELVNMPALMVSQLKYDPSPAPAGEYFKLYINVQNYGLYDAENVSCTLVPEYPFSLDPNEDPVRDIGTLRGNDDALLEYKVRVDSAAVNGDNELKLECTAGGNRELSVTRKLTVSVESMSPAFAAGTMTSAPAEIHAGDDSVKLSVELQNIGDGPAKLVTAELILPEGFSASSSYSDMFNIGAIDKDSVKNAVFYIDVADGVSAGAHDATLRVKYKSDNNNVNDYLTNDIPVEIRVKPSPNLAVEEVLAGTGTSSGSFTGYIVKGGEVVSPSEIAQGSSDELRVRLINNGEDDANSVSVKVFRDSSQPFTFDEVYDYVGNLAPGESGDAVFTFTVDGNAVLKKYLVDVEMRYVEGSDVRTVKATVPIDVTKSSSDLTPMIAGVAIAVIALGLFFWKRKK